MAAGSCGVDRRDLLHYFLARLGSVITLCTKIVIYIAFKTSVKFGHFSNNQLRKLDYNQRD